MGETENLQDGCDCKKNGSRLIVNFSFFRLGPAVAYMSWKNIGFQLPMCQFLSKFVLETKFVPLSSRGHTVFKTVKLPRWRKTRIGCDWQSQFISRKTNIDHNKCIKIQMKILIYLIYWISRPYLPRINSCFTNILNQWQRYLSWPSG